MQTFHYFRKLPDTAIDLLDEATSRLRMKQQSMPEEISQLGRKILTLKIESKQRRISLFALGFCAMLPSAARG